MEILSLGSKVKQKRKEKNMKLKDLAGDRITPGQISLIETGKSNPSDDLLKYLAEKLDTTVEYLLESETKQAENVCKFYSDIVEASLYCENCLRAEENIEKGLHYAEKYNIDMMKGIFNYQKSKLAFIREDFEKAQEYALFALIIFLKISNPMNVIKSYILLGKIAIINKEYKLALNYLKEAEKSYQNYNIDDKFMRINIYYNTAKCLSSLSEHVKAVDYALILEREVKELEDHKMYANTLMIIALAYAERKEKYKALEYAAKAKEICSKKADLTTLANVEEGIGDFLISALSIEDGIEHLNKALKLKLSIKDEDTDETMIKIIEGLVKCSRPQKALKEIEILEDNNYISNKIRIKIFECKYKIFKDQNNIREAEKQILNLISFLEVIDETKKLIYYYMLIGNFYDEINEKDLAIKYFKKAFKLREGKYYI